MGVIHDRLLALTRPGEVLRIVVSHVERGQLPRLVVDRQSDAKVQQVSARDETIDELLDRIEAGEGVK